MPKSGKEEAAWNGEQPRRIGGVEKVAHQSGRFSQLAYQRSVRLIEGFRDPRDSFEQLDLLEMVATTCGRPFGELQDDRSRAHRSPQLAH